MESQSKLFPLWGFRSSTDVSKSEVAAPVKACNFLDESESIVSFKEFHESDLIGDESQLSVLSEGEFKPMFCSTPIFPDSDSDIVSRALFPENIPTFSESYEEFSGHPTNTSTPMNMQTPCTPTYR